MKNISHQFSLSLGKICIGGSSCEKSEGESGTIVWGDSLHGRAPPVPLVNVNELKDATFPCLKWSIDFSVNWMRDDLKMSTQQDGYSCGCYCLSAIRRYAKGKCELTHLSFSVYTSEDTQKVRDACVNAFINTSFQYFEEHGKFEIPDIFRALCRVRGLLTRKGPGETLIIEESPQSVCDSGRVSEYISRKVESSPKPSVNQDGCYKTEKIPQKKTAIPL